MAEEKMTPEQAEEAKVKMTRFYKEQMEYLTTRKEYEETLAEIEEAKIRALKAKLEYITIHKNMKGPEEVPTTNQPTNS